MVEIYSKYHITALYIILLSHSFYFLNIIWLPIDIDISWLLELLLRELSCSCGDDDDDRIMKGNSVDRGNKSGNQKNNDILYIQL